MRKVLQKGCFRTAIAVVLLLCFGFLAVAGQGVHFSTCAHHWHHEPDAANDCCCPHKDDMPAIEKPIDVHDENTCSICSFFHGLRHTQLPQPEGFEILLLEHSLTDRESTPLKEIALQGYFARGPPQFS